MPLKKQDNFEIQHKMIQLKSVQKWKIERNHRHVWEKLIPAIK